MAPVAAARLADLSLARLDDYARSALGCPPETAHAGGVTLLADPARARVVWHGYTLPIVGLSFAAGAVFSVRPDVVEQLRREMGSDVTLPALDAAAVRRALRAVKRTLPSAFTLAGDLRAADAGTFQPSPTAQRAELIPRDDPLGVHVRSRFDGEVFGVRGPQGRIVAWAALKLKTPSVWELAVATEADYRGRGYGRDVVSAATRFALDSGTIPIYVHDRDNSTSAFVSRALGYQVYAEMILGEY